MLRSRLLPWLFSAGFFLAAACSDSVAPGPEPTAAAPAPIAPAGPTLVTLSGSVHATGEDLYPAWLSTEDGQDIRLTGENANILVSVDNAGVEVHGRWETDGANAFFVADFLVKAVNGSAVVDGILIELAPLSVDSPVYAIRQTNGGAYIMLFNPPAELLTHLNERIWIAGLDELSGPTAFGVIREM